MRILILGAGAVGGYFGGRLLEAGANVTFLVREIRARQLAADGVVIESGLGDVRVPANTIIAGTDAGPFDAVILTCKAHGLDDAIRDISPYVGNRSAVLPLLNGIRHLEVLTERFGPERVWGGSCHIGVALDSQGVIHHLNELNAMSFGALPGTHPGSIVEFAELISKAGVDGGPSADISRVMWNKFVFLATLAGMTCVMRASVGEIVACRDGERLMTSMLGECEKVAIAAGYAPEAEIMELYRAELTQRNSTTTSSMLRDIRDGGRTEADHILGDMVSRATAGGIDVPLLRAAYCHLQAYELGRSGTDGKGAADGPRDGDPA